MKEIRLATQSDIDGFIAVNKKVNYELGKSLTLNALIFSTIGFVNRSIISADVAERIERLTQSHLHDIFLISKSDKFSLSSSNREALYSLHSHRDYLKAVADMLDALGDSQAAEYTLRLVNDSILFGQLARESRRREEQLQKRQGFVPFLKPRFLSSPPTPVERT